MPYYYVGRSGDPFVGETLHSDDGCATLSDGVPTRPLAESTVDAIDSDTVDWCPTCTVRGESEQEDGDTTDGEDICTVELSSGGTCGREKPCPYHDA